MKKTILFLLISFLTPRFLYAEVSSPSLMADREFYNVGDPIRLKIELEGRGYSLGDIDASRIAPFEMTGKEEIYSEEKGSTSFIIKGAVYEVGEFTVPPFVITDSGGGQIHSMSGLISIRSVRDKDDDRLRDLKAQMSVDERGPVWPWVVLAFILAAFVLLIYWLYRRKKALAPAPYVPQKTPYDAAMEALAEIEKMELIRDGKIKSLYTRVSDIVRSYEGALYGLDAMEMTTGELLDALRKGGLADLTEVSRFLGDCDRVKFAKYTPPGMDVEGLAVRARRIIDSQKIDSAEEESHAD